MTDYTNTSKLECQKFSFLYYSPFFIVANKETAFEKQVKEEEKILESVAEKTALMGVAELAKGIEYTDPILTGSGFTTISLVCMSMDLLSFMYLF